MRNFATLGCVTLAACGFQLRGEIIVPFKAVHITAPAGSSISGALGKQLRSNKTLVVDDASKADGKIAIIEESREKLILSLSAAGKVREYQLKLRVVYTLTDSKGAVLIPRSEMNLTRIMSYDDAFVLAKQQEEELLYRDMNSDVVQQIVRRMVLAGNAV